MTETAPVRLLLLVEDDPDDAYVVEQYLTSVRVEGRPYEPKVAKTLADALELLQSEGFETIVLDLRLPDSEGFDTLRRTRAAAPDLPIVVLTGSRDEGLSALALEEGAQDLLRKHELSPTTLAHSVRYAIVRKQLDDRNREHAEALAAELEDLRGSTGARPVTSTMMGEASLSETDPKEYAEVLETFTSILLQGLEEQRLQVNHGVAARVRALAKDLGRVRASHTDVVELIRDAVKQAIEGETPEFASVAMRESRLRGFQLLGFLASYYRTQTLASRTARKAVPAGGA